MSSINHLEELTMRMMAKSVIAGAAVSLAMVAASGVADAALCVTDTLATYIGLGAAGCTIGDKTFFGFNYSQVIDGPTAAMVNVVPIAGQFGFNFQSAWNAPRGTITDDIMGFSVVGPPGTALIRDAHLALLGSPDDGSISVGETVSNFANGVLLGGLSEHLPPLGSDVGDVMFAPVNGVTISKNIDVVGAVTGAAVVSLSQITQTITQTDVPEPASLAILAISLLGMGAAYRRSRK
jgi:hypothetical protein